MLTILSFMVGLFVGWFFLPAPAVAVSMRDWLVEKIPGLGAYRKD